MKIESVKFNNAVSRGQKIYLSKDKHLQTILKNRLKAKKKEFKQMTPEYNTQDYICLTCGSTDNKEHPQTAYCFHCDTDNWEII